MKRTFDVTVSVLGLLLLLPLLAAIGVMILAIDGPPIFFRQERIGYRRKPFRIWKFRTMIPNAEASGIPLTVGHDPRVTRSGRWLRKTKLDELPQLLNVLVGEMSFVGPRPEVERYVNHYTDEQCRVLDFVPGITDAASIRYRDESQRLQRESNPERTYLEAIVPEKIRLNLEYARQANVLRDFGIIMRTLAVLCRR